jgi:hypothetical protein
MGIDETCIGRKHRFITAVIDLDAGDRNLRGLGARARRR